MTSYRYSADGQRYWKKTGTAAREYYSLDGSTTAGLFTESGTLKHWNIVAGGEVVGRYEGTTKKYYFTDHLGSTRAVVNSSGTVLEAYDDYPWGLQMPTRSYGTGTREKFTGKEHDAESGFDYSGARYYMPAYGRWGSVDPMEDLYAGVSPYAYVLDNPVNKTDPDGRCPSCILGAAIGAAADYGIQVAVNLAKGDGLADAAFNHIDGKSIAVSAAAGAISSGIAVLAEVREFGLVAKAASEIAVDASASAAGQYVSDGKVSGSKVAEDVVLGQTVGKVVGGRTEKALSESRTGQQLERQADRTSRIAANRGTARRQATRNAQAQEAKAERAGYTMGRGAAAGPAAAGAGSKVIDAAREDDKEE